MKYDHPNKNIVRDQMFSYALFDNPEERKSILTLPGPNALCVERMASLGLINKDTRQQWIEHRTQTAKHLEALATASWPHANVYKGLLEEFTPTTTYDLCNIDLESGVTVKIARWISDYLVPYLLPGAVILINYTAWSRNNLFPKFFQSIIVNDKELIPYWNAVANQMNTIDERIITTNLILRFALGNSFEIEQIPCHPYKDGKMEMISTGLRILREYNHTPKFPSIISFCDRFSPPNKVFERNTEETILTKIREKLSTMGLIILRNHENKWQVKMNVDLPPMMETTNLTEIAKALDINNYLTIC